jgi:hypothetical protein
MVDIMEEDDEKVYNGAYTTNHCFLLFVAKY